MDNHKDDLIKKSLLYLDNQNNKYKKFIKNVTAKFDQTKNKVIFNINDKDIIYDYEILGIYNFKLNIFMWSWALPYYSINETKISRELLNYGLNLEPSSNTMYHYFLKSLLINARNHIDTDFELELIQAITAYISKDKYNFIYPRTVIDKEKKLLFIIYYIVKI
jgi:hypothetical protein